MTPEIARTMWQVIEPLNAVVYFAPEPRAATDGLGLKGGWMSYFALRAAPLGPVPAEIVIATFYNFHPDMVRRAIPDAWSLASPEDVLAARGRSMGAALERSLTDWVRSSECAEAAGHARRAVEAAEVAGRPLFAANAALEWPDAPHVALWHACTCLREHRGDGHVACLVAAGLDPIESHVTASAAGSAPPEMMQKARMWSPDDWDAAHERLRERGWLDDDGLLTDQGVGMRASLERATDELAMRPWEALGEDDTRRLYAILRGAADRVVEGGGLPFPNPMGLPWPPLEWPEP